MEGKGITDDRLDGDFIAKQKRRLLGMKAELERMRHGLEGDADGGAKRRTSPNTIQATGACRCSGASWT